MRLSDAVSSQITTALNAPNSVQTKVSSYKKEIASALDQFILLGSKLARLLGSLCDRSDLSAAKRYRAAACHDFSSDFKFRMEWCHKEPKAQVVSFGCTYSRDASRP